MKDPPGYPNGKGFEDDTVTTHRPLVIGLLGHAGVTWTIRESEFTKGAVRNRLAPLLTDDEETRQ